MSADEGRLREAFERTFGRAPEVIAVAPGRVNLIGEHTDYNHGFVLPVAIDRTVAVAAAVSSSIPHPSILRPSISHPSIPHPSIPQGERAVRAHSLDFADGDEFSMDRIERAEPGSWKNYVRGVARALSDAGYPLGAADLAIEGDVPRGAGLSSSAAIEVAVAGALLTASGQDIAARDLALLAQKAENQFVGVQCGIMDQFAAALCRAGHALLIDCRSLEVEQVQLPFEEQGVAVVVVDSKVPRRLGSTAYNRRREECAEAARALGVASLRDANLGQLEGTCGLISDEVYARAQHVITENGRVLTGVEGLRAGDLQRFGALMYESHESLRDDFDVSTPELDLLVELARGLGTAIGARLTGAGFGGCTVNLVRQEKLDLFQREVVYAYRARTGLPAESHVCRAVDGLRVTRG